MKCRGLLKKDMFQKYFNLFILRKVYKFSLLKLIYRFVAI